MSEQVRVGPDEWEGAVGDCDGYQLIVAGPGAGKSRFIVHRVAAIVEGGRAARDQVLVLSFSRRSARSLAERINKILGGSTVPIDATTFHSLALRILERASGGQSPTPLTTPEQVATVRELLSDDPPDNWPHPYRGLLTSSGFADEVADFLMRCSERLLIPDDLEVLAEERADWKGIPPFYRRYLQHLDSLGRVDYGTLLVKAVGILEADPSLAGQYRYVLVDEYQDTSPAQARMSDLLSRPSGNLTVTGDPYQSIYSFRGAELRNIDDFAKQHPGVRHIVLDQSLRVPEEILGAALRVVSGGQLPGAAGPMRPAPHRGRVECYVFDQDTAEAEWIATQVDRAIHLDGSQPQDIAILVRSKQEMLNELSRALTRRSIPHDRPDRRLIDHPAVQAVSDLVVLAATDTDPATAGPVKLETSDAAARRLLLGPLFSMSIGRYRGLLGQRRQGLPWSEVLSLSEDTADLAELVAAPGWATTETAVHGFWKLWTSLPAFASIVDDPERSEWRRAYASLAQVLDSQADRNPEISLSSFFRNTDEETFEATPLLALASEEKGVSLTTLHQAKGLEFDQVFIANAVEGVFPDLRRSRRMLRPELLSPERTTDATAVSAFQIQEEMRLAYTAMTRARHRVVWTATEAGIDQGERRPSRFLLAASGAASMDEIGRPTPEELAPISLGEAEISLRRTAADPGAAVPARTAAVATLAASPRGWWDARYFPGVPQPGPDAPILGDRFTMSPSQADGYDRCPRRYAVERRLRLGEPATVYMSSGSAIHKALEVAESAAMASGERHSDVEVAVAALHKAWDGSEYATPALSRAWLKRGEDVIRLAYQKWPASSAPAAGLELEVEADIDGVTWKGVVDRLERSAKGLRIVDYKTGKTAPTREEAAVSIQLGFYTMAVQEKFPDSTVVAAELWFPAAKAQSMTIRSLDLDRIDEVADKLREVTRLVASEKWEPRISSQCRSCAIRSSCPAWPEGRGAFLA